MTLVSLAYCLSAVPLPGYGSLWSLGTLEGRPLSWCQRCMCLTLPRGTVLGQARSLVAEPARDLLPAPAFSLFRHCHLSDGPVP